MKAFRIFPCFLVILHFAAAALPAQTVMTKVFAEVTGWDYVDESSSADSPSSRSRELLRLFDSGIMETLFNLGYICFNEDVGFGPSAMEETERGRLLNLARTGGADYLVVFEGQIALPEANEPFRGTGALLLVRTDGTLLARTDVPQILAGSAFSLGMR